jgi:AcrR family transcriptional regulator
MREIPAPPATGDRLSAARRREQLLACAIKVFAEHGLEAGSHVLVAAEAGVSVPLCFFHFKTREALVDAVLTEVEQLYRGAFALADREDVNAAQALQATSDALIATMDGVGYATRIFIDWSVAVRSATWPRFLRLHRHLVAVLTRVILRGQREGLFRDDLDAEDEAELLHASSFGLAQLRMAGASARRIERFQQSMMRRIHVAAHPTGTRPAAGGGPKVSPAD